MRLNYRPGLPILVALLACGPTTPGTTDATTTTDGTSTVAPTSTTPTTTAGEPSHTDPSTLEQVCIDFCLNLIERDSGCALADIACYDGCMEGFEFAGTCLAEQLAARRCEAEAAAFDDVTKCEASECAAVYLAADVCNGWCYHLGGNPSSGGDAKECEWGSQCLDDHDYEMVCSLGDAPFCTCWVDNNQVGACQHDGALEQFCDGVHVFSGCCKEFFLPVLQPAAVEPAPAPEPGGTASPGDPCPLVGLHLACEHDGVVGVTYCDDDGNPPEFGPCIAEPECSLLVSACEGTCQLHDGVPTWVPEDCGGNSTG
ncbi:hypothetical protein [Nannocystis punicea]|uniref:Uncharacterized protein n=1 Tax=Nannocystis punicea TaxID=2995304 RepID=A0ABY7HJJ6_9BACT|nr:hypothetical protein [Nannocystis poenicansa]WAS99288.1 hypothetical protein O0S08_24435 [Nannocystis poenicansa]